MKNYDATDLRLHELARKAGEERALVIGEAIGNALAIAWEGLQKAGAWLRHRALRPAPVTREMRTSIR